ncbi:hypothetical protein AQI70_13430 [Streptomyces curacoi]|uniref:4'-phosphopantetheinyl transferase domain-containing protein n=1 Tax=Streptomyces curacoi TaxID=146536 RepID=A0A117PFB1_9ACTN|nr:hypothetical protein AQI70_13430 [Streptomyces curacoi]
MTAPSRALVLLSPQQIPPADDPQWEDWLTATELMYSHGFRRAHEHLAARKAAKQAAARLLGLPLVPDMWHAMEIHRRTGSGPALNFTGAAAHQLRRLAVPHPALSLTHARGYAAALAWIPARSAGS